MLTLRQAASQILPNPLPLSALTLAGQTRFRPKDASNRKSLRYILGRFDLTSGTRAHSLLAYNTFLMRARIPYADFIKSATSPSNFPLGNLLNFIPGLGDLASFLAQLPTQITEDFLEALDINPAIDESKPDLPERADDIGDMLVHGGGGDIAVLCEVWNDDLLARITAKLVAANIGYTLSRGPEQEGDWSMLGSGLAVIGLNLNATRIAEHVFTRAGNRVQDADAWARKGIMLTRVDLGIGKVDIFSTHLISGDDLGPEAYAALSKIGVKKPTDADSQTIRFQQLQECVDFIRANWVPENVKMLVGDFNTDAQNPAYYQQLITILDQIGFTDLWEFKYRGSSNGLTDAGDITDLWKICARIGSEPTGQCDETIAPSQSTGRIDYIFVEKPNDAHMFNVDFGHLTRRSFPRSHPTAVVPYMSDHLGLGVAMFCSPTR